MLHPEFLLIEEGRNFSSKVLTDSQSTYFPRRYIEVNYAHFSAGSLVLFTLLQSLIEAKSSNIPLILNRTGQHIDKTNLPEYFAIGVLTSGTTGIPKLIFHRFEEILPANTKKQGQNRWLLCYHPMSFAGLQVILQTMICGDVLIASTFSKVHQKADESITYQVNALSATPSLMRTLLLCWNDHYKPALTTITCGGELCDQGTLDALKTVFPQASIRHIYATTETGVLFSIKDNLEGFPASFLQQKHHGWQIIINNDELVVSKPDKEIKTGDKVLLKKNRIYFKGRFDNIVNIGGIKVELEQLEHRVMQLEGVIDARTYAKKNPITGAIVCVELVSTQQELVKKSIEELNKQLNPAERLRLIYFVEAIALSDTGKKQRIV